jgi:hypothetical protein
MRRTAAAAERMKRFIDGAERAAQTTSVLDGQSVILAAAQIVLSPNTNIYIKMSLKTFLRCVSLHKFPLRSKSFLKPFHCLQ